VKQEVRKSLVLVRTKRQSKVCNGARYKWMKMWRDGEEGGGGKGWRRRGREEGGGGGWQREKSTINI
jgi:hypothetical protein